MPGPPDCIAPLGTAKVETKWPISVDLPALFQTQWTESSLRQKTSTASSRGRLQQYHSHLAQTFGCDPGSETRSEVFAVAREQSDLAVGLDTERTITVNDSRAAWELWSSPESERSLWLFFEVTGAAKSGNDFQASLRSNSPLIYKDFLMKFPTKTIQTRPQNSLLDPESCLIGLKLFPAALQWSFNLKD